MTRSPEPDSLPASDQPVIQASELSQYSFCHRAWWLGMVKGLPSRRDKDLGRGIRHHKRHGYRVAAAGRWRQLGLIFLGSGGFLFILVLVWLWFS